MHPAVRAYKSLPAPKKEGWEHATTKAKAVAQSRLVIVKPLTLSESLNKAYEQMRSDYDSGHASVQLVNAIDNVGKMPSKATVYGWVSAYNADGLPGLLPQHRGRVAKAPVWSDKALEYYHCTNKPTFSGVAYQLKKDGYNVDAPQVRRFIRSLPNNLGSKSAWRMGAKLHRESQKDHLLRDTTHIPPGFLYNADGHTLDVYLAHPVTGKAYRPELTAFQDVGSRCVVGWELSYSESAISTMTALTRAIKTHDHVPAMLYVDNGSGYKSKMMSDEVAGIYAMFEIDTIFAIPGNARAKWIERFFRHMEGIVGKQFNSYCGPGHSERHITELLNKAKKDNSVLPTVSDWIAEFNQFLEVYHNSPHPEQPNKTRLQVWQDGLVKVKPHVVDYEVLPKQQVNVRRGRVVLHHRIYTADSLFTHNDTALLAAYNLHDDSHIKLYNFAGEFVMHAQLKHKTKALPNSRIEEAAIKRLAGQRKRLHNKLAEVEAQADLDNINAIEGKACVVDESEQSIAYKSYCSPAVEHIEQAPPIDLSALFTVHDDDDENEPMPQSITQYLITNLED